MKGKLKIINAIKALFMLFLVATSSHLLCDDAFKLQSSPSELHLKLGLYEHSLIKYHNYLSDDICETLIKENDDIYLHRNIIELSIICLAFQQQGIKLVIAPIIYPNIPRAITMVEEGVVDSLQVTVWQDDIKVQKAYQSVAIIRKNEYEKGIYVYEKHPLLKQKPDNIDLKSYIGITKKVWQYDWKIINQLTTHVADVNHLPSLFDMLKNGRADFTLYDFSSDDEFIPLENHPVSLKPIKGVKVVLPASRHFIVAKKWPHAKRYLDTLNKGIAQLRLQGTITKLYHKAGFFNEKTRDWRVLNK